MNYDYLFWLIVLAQFLDICTTDDVLGLGGREAGPIKFLFSTAARIGADAIDVIVAAKFLLLCLIAGLHTGGQLGLIAYWALLIGYGAVLWSNLHQTEKQKEANKKTNNK